MIAGVGSGGKVNLYAGMTSGDTVDVVVDVVGYYTGTIPDAPTNVHATGTSSSTSATVSWSAPPLDGGAGIDYYVAREFDASSDTLLDTTQVTGTSYTATGLSSNGSYYWRVVAHNVHGASLQSAPSANFTPVPAQHPCLNSDHCWGLDTTTPQTSSSLSTAASEFGGYPDFLGRYITGTYAMSSSELATYHTAKIGVLMIADTYGGSCASSSAGSAEASAASSAAGNLGASANGQITLFIDLEPSGTVTSSCIQAYADGVVSHGYRAGYYLSPSYQGSAFCSVTGDANVSNAVIYSYSPSGSQTTKSSSPAFGANGTPCTGGHTEAWQYALGGTGPITPDYDEDEVLPTALDTLLYP